MSPAACSSLRHSLAPLTATSMIPSLVESEDDLALQRVGRVVEVHDRPRRALQALVGALDQFLAALHQHLDRHVVGDAVLVDQLAHEVEVGLARRREPDLDLLEAHRHEFLEHPQLASRVHRIDERLVAVAQVDRAPLRCRGDRDVRPGAVGEHDRHERRVLLEGHLLRGDVLGRHSDSPDDRRLVSVSSGGVRTGRGIWPEKARTPRPVGRGVRANAGMWRSPYRSRRRSLRNIAANTSTLGRISRSPGPRRYAGDQHD